MKKLKSILLCCFAFLSSNIMAQEAVVAAGGDATGSGGSSSYSVGQPFYTVSTGSNGSTTAGVQQPYEFYVGIDKVKTINLSMVAFPNPTTSILNLSVEDLTIGDLNAQLYDASGKLILSKNIVDNITQIPMQELAGGSYFLKVSQDKVFVKTFTIIKNK